MGRKSFKSAVIFLTIIIAASTVIAGELVFFMSDVDTQTVGSVLGQIREVGAQEEIVMVVNSFGGDVGHGFALYDLMTKIIKPSLTTVGLGDIASMAVIVFLSGERRVISDSAVVFLHDISMTLGQVSSLEANLALKSCNMNKDKYAQIVSEKSGGKLTKERVVEMMNKQTILTAKEMVDFGLAHELLSEKTFKNGFWKQPRGEEYVSQESPHLKPKK